jgi:hypothetical protein
MALLAVNRRTNAAPVTGNMGPLWIPHVPGDIRALPSLKRQGARTVTLLLFYADKEEGF